MWADRHEWPGGLLAKLTEERNVRRALAAADEDPAARTSDPKGKAPRRDRNAVSHHSGRSAMRFAEQLSPTTDSGIARNDAVEQTTGSSDARG